MKIFKSISALITAAGALTLIASPAFAGSVRVPEPGTLSLLAAGIVGAIIVARLRNRK